MSTDTTDTTDTTGSGGGAAGKDRHLGELALRRYLAGELAGAEHGAAAAHAARCATCTRRMEGLIDEQRSFEERISFDRFAAGVSRAARVPAAGARAVAVSAAGGGAGGVGRWWNRPANGRSFVAVMSAGTLAAGLAMAIGLGPLRDSWRAGRDAARDDSGDNGAGAGTNRIKGGSPSAEVVMRIAPPGNGGPQRTAAVGAPEAMVAGERIRIGVKPGGRRYLFVVALDDKGALTPLYPEVGTSLPLPRGGGMQYLPESVELTGHGRERLVVLATDVPLDLDTIRRSVDVAFRKVGGDLGRLPPLALPGEQFHQTFLKP